MLTPDDRFERLAAFAAEHDGPPTSFLGYRRTQLELALALSGVDFRRKDVVEVGGGVSGQSFLLASLASRVTSTDLLNVTSEHGSDLPRAARIRALAPSTLWFVCGRGEGIPLRDGCADIVFSSYVLEHVTDRSATVAEIRRVLRPGGHAVILVPNVMESVLRLVWATAVYMPRQLAKLVLVRTGIGRRLGVRPRFAPDLRYHSHGTYSGIGAEIMGSRIGEWDDLFRDQGFDIVRRFTLNFEAYVGILGDTAMFSLQRLLAPATRRVGAHALAIRLGPGYGLMAQRRVAKIEPELLPR